MTDFLSHPKADEALEWVQGEGSAEQRAAFEQSMEQDPELRALVDALSEGSAVLAMSIPPMSPPDELKGRLLDRIDREEPDASGPAKVAEFPGTDRDRAGAKRRPLREALAWAAAIAFAAGCGWFWKQKEDARDRLARAQQEIGSLSGELLKARRSRDFAKLEVESLKATIDEYREGVALVVWDEEEQEGVLKLEKMPPIPVDKDYQLWVVDPAQSAPVNAGVVQVSEDGFARVRFKPVSAVTSADKFAISVERRGGVPQNEGPIVLLSP